MSDEARSNGQNGVAASVAIDGALGSRVVSAGLLFEELEHIYQTAPVGLCLMDCDLRFVRINDCLANINGLPAEYHIGKKLRDVIPGLAVEVEPIYRKVIESKQPVLNYEISRPDPASSNASRYYLVSYHPLIGDSGSVLGVGTVVQDVTDRKLAEFKLRQREQLLSEAERNANVGSWRLDVRTGNVEWSDQLYRIFDVADSVAPSFELFLEHVHPDDREQAHDRFLQQLESDVESDEFEFRIVRPDGSVRYIQSVTRFIRSDTGEPLVVYGTDQDITDRSTAELNLRNSTEELTSILETATDIVLSLDLNGTIKYVNHVVPGLRKDEVIGSSGFDYILPEGHDKFQQAMDHVRTQKTHYEYELQATGPHGSTAWYSCRLGPVLRDTEVVGFVLLTTDITVRRDAEVALRKSERLFRTIFEQAAVGVALIDTITGRIVEVNDKYAELLEYTADELKTKTFMELTFPEDLAEDLARMAQIHSGEIREFGLEKRIVKKSGIENWFHLTVSPTWSPGEEPRFHIAIIKDIQDRKEIEAQLEASRDELENRVQQRTQELTKINQQLLEEMSARKRISEERERLTHIIEATPDFVGTANLKGEVQYINQAIRTEIGVPHDKPANEFHIGDFHPEADTQALMHEIIPEVIHRGKWRGELSWRTQDGRTIPTAMVLQSHVSPSGEVELISTIAHDISELKRVEKTLLRAERLVSIGTLAAGIAHEINNPLGAMLLTSEFALQNLDDTAEVKESLESIVSQVERCAEIVRGVLQLSRDGNSKKKPYQLEGVLRRALDLTRQQAGQAGVHVQMDDLQKSCLVQLNPLEMEQVLVNLILNAIQASEKDSKVSLAYTVNSQSVQVFVRDHGAGMEPDVVTRVFDPFFTTKLHSGGTGLGLSIVHGIVQDHGGHVDVSSQPEEGTEVVVTLPLAMEGASNV